jgi:FkbM family methyltransferase
MRAGARRVVRRLIESTGYRVTRLAPNRFDAMEPVLQRLSLVGFTPRIVIDAGANVGAWTGMARRIFPGAEFHAIEPQPACRAALEGLDGVQLHLVALTRPGSAAVRMAGAGTTGAWIVDDASADAHSVSVPASTLDQVIGGAATAAKRPLLKLDLEGHELAALEGATAVLSAVEVIITEVRFYDVYGGGLPVFSDLMRVLVDRGFELYDIAALGARARDGRLRSGDVVFVRRGSPLVADLGLE